MLADGCPAALLAHRPIPVMLAVPCLSIPDADLLFLVQVLPSRGPVRLLHRLTRDELCRLARHWHHKYNECRDADVPSNDHASLGEFLKTPNGHEFPTQAHPMASPSLRGGEHVLSVSRTEVFLHHPLW